MWYKFENYKDPSFPIYSSEQTRTGTVVGAHYHGAMELLQILHGTPLLTVDTTQIRCQPGDLFFIPAFAVHSLEGEEECSIRGITFEPVLLDEALCGVDLKEQFGRSRVTDLLWRAHCTDHGEMKAAFDRLFEGYHTPSSTRRAAVLSALYGVLEVLMRRYCAMERDERAFRRLQPAIRYMEEHFAEGITLEQISGVLNICPDHCIRLFREQVNKTPMRYLADLRLTEAMKRLVETDLSVGAIAAECGYSTAAHLTKTFKDRLGITPREYRRRTQN